MSRAALVPNSKSDADHIYYTASVINNTTSTSGLENDPIARFVETRDTPILKDANDYECCVMKVVINGAGKNLPILIPQIQPGASPTKTIYSVTLNAVVYDVAGGDVNDLIYVSSGEVFLEWIPENFDLSVLKPASALPTQVDTSYYYLYSYNHWVVIINNALKTAYDQLVANIQATPGNGGYVMANRQPTVEFDENTNLFSFYTDTTNTSWGNTQGPPVYANLGPAGTNVFPTALNTAEFMFVGFNLNFEGLMCNFDTQYYGKDEVPWAMGFDDLTGVQKQLYEPENTLLVRNKSGTNVQNVISPTTGLPYVPALLNFVTTQDFESTSTLWSPVGGIVLTTQLLPLRNEFVSSPVAFGSSSGTQGSAAFQTVLLDFNPVFQSTDEYRGLLTFQPDSEFIPVAMTQSHQEVKSIDFTVCWRNRLTNQLVPMRLYNCGSLSVRLLFRRRE